MLLAIDQKIIMKVLVKELEIASRHLKLKREFIKLPAIDQKERYQGTCNIKKRHQGTCNI